MTKVLIVDDDSMMRKILATALEPLHLQLHFCSDGIYALDALRCNRDFDLVITDISMPVLDGRQLIRSITSDKALAQIPILIMSGVVGVNEIADLLDLGASRFIPKPFNMETLREDVLNCLDQLQTIGQ